MVRRVSLTHASRGCLVLIFTSTSCMIGSSSFTSLELFNLLLELIVQSVLLDLRTGLIVHSPNSNDDVSGVCGELGVSADSRDDLVDGCI